MLFNADVSTANRPVPVKEAPGAVPALVVMEAGEVVAVVEVQEVVEAIRWLAEALPQRGKRYDSWLAAIAWEIGHEFLLIRSKCRMNLLLRSEFLSLSLSLSLTFIQGSKDPCSRRVFCFSSFWSGCNFF